MNKIKPFIKRNWFSLLLVAFVLLLIFKENSYPTPLNKYSDLRDNSTAFSEAGLSLGYAPSNNVVQDFIDESVSSTPTQRMTVENIFTSLKVKDVSESLDSIGNEAERVGGFTVSSDYQSPNENSSGNITVRVPKSSQDDFIKYLQDNSIKVVSFNVNAQDVTDEYQDTQERLRILEQNKIKLEEIMNSAVNAEEMLNTQKAVFEVQRQIESLVGRQKYLEDTSSTTKISIYVATDEYALPYIPDNNFRPEVIFKNAVRSLVETFRGVAGFVIWAVVYSLIWIPLALVGYFLWRKYLK